MSRLHEKLKKAKKCNESRSPWNRYDLHYLTVNVAVRYVLETVEKEKTKKKHKDILHVTGNENRSVDGVAAIKNAVLRDFNTI
ncbi:hypothetical protein CRE_29128 [Caenorhabditis remanei]|uniref:Uncharacterized protein n=1 Tax=Caenorhabditis remanei TaxID=31234 RepID=E3N4N7_CAERE|nr:hypothetical protein CRE_29128 [Caenorhabditis remanei]